MDEVQGVIDSQVGRFVSLQKDDWFTCFFDDDGVIIRETWYNPKSEQSEDYTEQHRKEGKEPQNKYVFHCYTLELNGKPVNRVQKFETNGRTAKKILGLRREYGKTQHKDGKEVVIESGLSKKIFKIRREGEGKKTEYAPYLMQDASADDIGKYKKSFAEFYTEEAKGRGSSEHASEPEPSLKQMAIAKLQAMSSTERMALMARVDVKTGAQITEAVAQQILDIIDGKVAEPSGNSDDDWLKE